MRKQTLSLGVGFFLLTSSAMANDYLANVEGLHLNYSAPSGTASSTHFKYKEYEFLGHTEYDVELQGGTLFLETPDGPIQLDNLPASLSEVDALTINDLDLVSSSTSLSLSTQRFATQSTDSAMDISRLAIQCSYEDRDDEFMNEILHSCFNRSGNLSLGGFSSDGKEVLTDTQFTIRNNSMNFQMRAQGLKIKGNGKTYYENDQLRIRIDKAKVGFLNVRGRLFKELEKLESSTVSVHEPWIEIDLK